MITANNRDIHVSLLPALNTRVSTGINTDHDVCSGRRGSTPNLLTRRKQVPFVKMRPELLLRSSFQF